MNTCLRKTFAVAVAIALGVASFATSAEPRSDGATTVPITTVIAAVAKRSGKKFIIDPRVQGDAVVLQENLGAMSYEDLLMLMSVHGFAAVANGDYVRVVPDAAVRQMAMPIADGDKHPLAEYVTRVLTVKSIPAGQLVPILRPMIPQQGHMVALPCTNNLIVVDTFGNIQRLEQVIKSLDRGEPLVPEKCKPGEAARPADKGNEK
jgi:type II secretory pathway component GspD/PulD (secretin)